MSDSESFTTLDDLINNHLSKPDVQASCSDNQMHEIIRSSVAAGLGSQPVHTAALQPQPQRFILPSFGMKEPGKSSILAKQVSNTIQAQELAERRRKEEEDQRHRVVESNEQDDDEIIDLMKGMEFPCKPEKDSMRKIMESNKKDEDDIIDLMKGLQFPYKPVPILKHPKPEMEQFEMTFQDSEMEEIAEMKQVQKLPCLLDSKSSYKVRVPRRHRAKPSSIGRAICTRYLEFQEPYLPKKPATKTVRFDFSTPSPDDVVKASMKQPKPIQPRIFK